VKALFKYFLFIPLLFVSFRAGFRTPWGPVFTLAEEVFIVLLILFFFSQLLAWTVGKDTPGKYELLIIFLLILPLFSAVNSYFHFGQPLIYGLATTRNFLLLISGLLFYYLLKHNVITLDHLKNIFLAAAWVTLSLFLYFYFTINPEKYADSFFIGYNPLKGGYIFKFQIPLLVFALLYYTFSFILKHRVIDLILSLPFYYMMIFIRQDRSIIIMCLLVIAIFFFRKIYVRAMLRYTVMLIITLLFALFIIEITDYRPPQTTLTKFYNLWLTVAGQETLESATNIRRIQVMRVWPDIVSNIWLGLGDISPQWKGGFARIYGYFYPSDIGLLGVIYLFGILGLLLLMTQYLLGYSISRKLKEDNLFIITCCYFLLFSFLDSFTSGQMVFFPANSMIPLGVIYYSYRIEQSVALDHVTTAKISSSSLPLPFSHPKV
jgi:hypothetical protein